MTLRTFILITFFLCTSCSKSGQDVDKVKDLEERQKREQIIKKNENEIKNLSVKYKSISISEIKGYYTYNIQEILIDQKNLALFNGLLCDITKSDSTYILHVYNTKYSSYNLYTFENNYIAEISMDSQKLIEFKKNFKPGYQSNYGCFVFKVTQITSKLPDVELEYKSKSEEFNIYSEFDLINPKLIFKGELIDYYFYQRLN